MLTVAINVLFAFVFFWGRKIEQIDVISDSVMCGITTSFISVYIAYFAIRKLRRAGALPAQAPESEFMKALPGNPLGLALVLALIFCVATPFVNSLLLAFYGITDFTFPRFVFWKAVYSFVLSMILLEVAVLRFVQSDCDEPGQPPQTGADAVRNPLPRAAALKSWFGSVTSDFGFNMISGLLLGGTQIIDGSVVIFPSTLSGIGVSAVVLGLIVSLRMTLPLAKSIRSSALDGSLPPLEREDKWLSWLPGSPAGFAAALFPLVAALAYIVFGSIMTLFDFQVLNFFQFFILRSIFMALLTKAVVWLAVRRWRQPSFASTHGA